MFNGPGKTLKDCPVILNGSGKAMKETVPSFF